MDFENVLPDEPVRGDEPKVPTYDSPYKSEFKNDLPDQSSVYDAEVPLYASAFDSEFKNELPDDLSGVDEPKESGISAVNDSPQDSSQPVNKGKKCKRKAPRMCRENWTPRKFWHFNLSLHIPGLIFAMATVILYLVDLCYSNNYMHSHHPTSPSSPVQTHLPVALVVIDALGITASGIAVLWSSIFLQLYGKEVNHPRLNRKWTALLDGFIAAFTTAIADVTLAMRSNPNNCGNFKRVGGCENSRTGIMSAAGALGIILSYARALC